MSKPVELPLRATAAEIVAAILQVEQRARANLAENPEHLAHHVVTQVERAVHMAQAIGYAVEDLDPHGATWWGDRQPMGVHTLVLVQGDRIVVKRGTVPSFVNRDCTLRLRLPWREKEAGSRPTEEGQVPLFEGTGG